MEEEEVEGEEEEGRKLAKGRCLPRNPIPTSNPAEEEVEREGKMMTSKPEKCFSSNKRETKGT